MTLHPGGNSTLLSARTINSKASAAGILTFPSIAAEEETSRYGGSPRKITNEPYNNFDPIGKRGQGKQEPLS